MGECNLLSAPSAEKSSPSVTKKNFPHDYKEKSVVSFHVFSAGQYTQPLMQNTCHTNK
jgi:hypothetical protein